LAGNQEDISPSELVSTVKKSFIVLKLRLELIYRNYTGCRKV